MALLYFPHTTIHFPPIRISPPLFPAKTKSAAVSSLHFSTFFSENGVVWCRRATTPFRKYAYPDPIPEFAESETRKFRNGLLKRLSKEKETFGDDLSDVVEVCVQIFGNFLHKEYGGPGTLLVEPFTDMMVALKERDLPGAPLAARASLLWAQNYVDQDWEIWNSKSPK
ncbi:hypothetical protein L484_027826 [Morus notabilis]|uniref:Protein PLASTID REDOX INSENSITIVE 2 n=1 Tax=Morus notabilis TaxID=981085 RepID=W9RL23_9ROSA|nr:protein PLASTID REDOX INSENSITIVE 2, chloroplastic [Morus notabilis]EXB82645.1 hypothetical protein L484_027826 [Morus notabilis]